MVLLSTAVACMHTIWCDRQEPSVLMGGLLKRLACALWVSCDTMAMVGTIRLGQLVSGICSCRVSQAYSKQRVLWQVRVQRCAFLEGPAWLLWRDIGSDLSYC